MSTRHALVSLCVLIASPLAAFQPTPVGPGSRVALDRVYAHLSDRRFDEAKAEWNRLAPQLQKTLGAVRTEAERRRRVGEAQFVQGLLAARFGTKDEALSLLREADGNGFPPLDSPLMVLAADTLFDLGEPTLAAQAYAEVLKGTPTAAAVRTRRGAALLSAGKLAEAGAELARVLREAPATPQAAYWLGALRFEEKRVDEAKGLLERELAREPRCTGCLAKLAHVAYLAGEDRECEALLAKAAALDPEHAEANLVAGMLANRAGRYDQAVEHLTRVVSHAGSSAWAHHQLAIAYRRSGRPEKAQEHQAIYDRLVQEQKARTLGVRGSE
jgi:tetratricopeptide (TPR) repeat protein